jgi:hypothetical protein
MLFSKDLIRKNKSDALRLSRAAVFGVRFQGRVNHSACRKHRHNCCDRKTFGAVVALLYTVPAFPV